MKAKDANMRFLFGSVLFFFMLLMMIVLFSYFTLQQSLTADTPVSKERYAISFSKQFDGTCYDLYLNDSLIYVGSPVSADTVIRASGKVADNALLLVEKSTDIVTVLEVKPHGKVVICYGKNGEVTLSDAGK